MKLQEELFKQRKSDAMSDTMLLLEHSPVYTMGKRGRYSDFRHGADVALTAGAEVHQVPRGGETTYHGPGQLIAYPIVNLRTLRLGARAYVEALEDSMIAIAALYGISAKGRIPGRTGVWVDERKLGAVGVAISGGVTCHGLALNVSTDIAAFDAIVPCGDPERQATSIAHESGDRSNNIVLTQVADALANAIASNLGFQSIEWLPDVNELLRLYGVNDVGT